MEVLHTDQAPQAIGPYSQAILADGFLFASGQIPIDPATGSLVEGDITVQTRQVAKNIQAVLAAAGMDFSNVVKTSCFLADMGDFQAFNEEYAKWFVSRPARSCVAVKTLPKNAKVEVEIIAR
ncbi:MAG: RidA family protein [Clostridia bacterium]|jgi:endoribonuclease L-PSP, putative|nr:RidA family protein [Clostridia bacterium]